MEAIESPPNSLPDVVETRTVTPPLNLQTLWPAGVLLGCVILAFWPLMVRLYSLWFGDDTYYAHGVVVPICAGLIVWDRWEKVKSLRVQGSNWALFALAPVLYISWFASRTDMHTFQSVLLLIVITLGTAFILGWRWLRYLAVPIAYLAFCLPLLDRFVDTYTQPIQRLSTDLSFQLLKVFGQSPYRVDTSTIGLPNYTLDVAVPCSGVKLVLAVTSIAIFFAFVAHMRRLNTGLLLASILPISLIVNALRISLIGIVGNAYGPESAHQFHDYSGYIGLVACFAILYGFTRMLGWK